MNSVDVKTKITKPKLPYQELERSRRDPQQLYSANSPPLMRILATPPMVEASTVANFVCSCRSGRSYEMSKTSVGAGRIP